MNPRAGEQRFIMRARWSAVLLAVVGGVVAGGCAGPRLASRPLTDEQLEWTSFIRASYRGWQPPNYSTTFSPAAGLLPVTPLDGVPSAPAARPMPGIPGGDVEFVPAVPVP